MFDKIGDIANIATRLATAYATGGASELTRLATDFGAKIIDQVLQQQNVNLPEPARDALRGYLEGV